jgi:exonuclease III
MDTKYKIVTLNVNGLRDAGKRSRIFTLLKLKNPEIVLLQETHCTSLTMAKQWEQEWGGKCFWSFGSARAKGVAIMLNPNLQYKIEHFEYDNDGRLLVLDLNCSDTRFRVLNIYAPNKSVERATWLKQLRRWVCGSKNLVFGGDFNFVENTSLDKIGGNLIYGNSGADIFCTYKQDFSLFDPFRSKFPNKVETTWHSADNSIACRLDRFYLSASFSTKVVDLVTSPVPDSDHSLVQLTINLEDLQTTGPGYWKCNTSILNDPDLVADMEELCACLREDATTKDTTWWETAKERFKKLIVIHSMRRADNTKRRVKVLERRIKDIEEDSVPLTGEQEEYIMLLKKEMKDILNERAEGAKIRSRIKTLDAEEVTSQFFLRKEKSRKEKSSLKELSVNGVKITDRTEIMKETTEFYKTLYSREPIAADAMDKIKPFVRKLDESSTKRCEGLITTRECREAIKEMKDNKSPGSDGLPREFYVKFFNLFQDLFVDVLNSAFDTGLLSNSQRYGVITLACKNPPKADLLANWRPISLLNVDYKILSKVLSKRLAAVLPECIHVDQTCSIPGRSITDNLHLVRNIADYCNAKNIPAAVVSFDQEKAFDRVSHDYLIQILQAYGFGESFIRWITLLYTNVESSVIVNGWIGPKFPVTRSVRQGCPLSALLYVLCIEPLAEAIRKDAAFDGLKLPAVQEEIRISQYADDTNTIVTSERSIETTLRWFEVYGKASGAKINKGKCVGLWLGPWKNRRDSPFGFKWTTCVKIYGVLFGENSTQQNSNAILDKVKKTVNLCKGRNLTLSAKAKLVNTAICSKLWYVGCCVLFPSTTIKDINKAIFKFIWNDQTELVSRKTIIETPLNGGLGVIDIESKLDSLICTHVKRLLTVSDLKWQDFAIYWIGLQLRRHNPTYASNLRPHAESPSPFYEKTLAVFRRVVALDPLLPVTNFSAKNTYTILKKPLVKPPRIMNKHPLINFTQTWNAVTNRFVSPRARELNWKIAHGVLPVNDYLYSLQIIRHNRCPFCDLPETLAHRFFACREVRLLWLWVDRLISEIAGKPFAADLNYVLFQRTMDLGTEDRTTLLVLSGEAKLAIWTQRNRVKYDKKRLFSRDILRLFIHAVKSRIQADFVRLDRVTFENIWCRGNPPLLAKTEGDQLTINITV